MRAVWLVRSRQMAARFRFWLAMFGYNPRDHSISHKIYLMYAAVFYILWGFMVLTLLADGTAKILAATRITPPAMAALAIAMAGLLGWSLLAALNASRRSPILFTEEDAYLICQTPADRRAVALAWLIGQWVLPALIVGALAVTLGFGVVEANSPNGLTTADLPRYLLAGLRIVSLVLPLHLGLNALVWALGVYRLGGARQVPRLFWLPVTLIALVLVGLFSTSALSGEAGFSPAALLAPLSRPPWTTVLLPLAWPIRAGFGQLAWTSGLLLALLVAVIGLGLLAWLAADLNLSRAAIESRYTAGQFSSKQAINLQPEAESRQLQRLGIGRPASRLPGREGWLSLVWKDIIQSGRLGLLRQLFYALAIFLFSLSAALVNDWGVRAWLALLWVIVVGQIATRRLRADLALWGIFRQLPLNPGRLIMGNAVLPLILISLLSWLGLWVGRLLGADAVLANTMGLLIPGLAAGVTLAAAMDTLRLGTTASLLAGDVPQPGMLAVLLGAAFIALAAGLVWRAQTFGLILAFWLTLFTAALLLRVAASSLRRMR